MVYAIIAFGLAVGFVVYKFLPKLTIEQKVQITEPVAYVILRKIGPSPDISSFGAIGSRKEQARAFAGWALWRFGATTEGTIWRRAISNMREKINDEWSPGAGDVILGAIASVVALVSAAFGGPAGIIAWGAHIGRQAQAAYSVKEELARQGAAYARALSGDAKRIAWEVKIFERIFAAMDYPQPQLEILRTINKDRISRATEVIIGRSYGTDAEIAIWKAGLIAVADSRVEYLMNLTNEEVAQST